MQVEADVQVRAWVDYFRDLGIVNLFKIVQIDHFLLPLGQFIQRERLGGGDHIAAEGNVRQSGRDRTGGTK